MKFKVKLFDAEGKDLEIENKVIGDIIFKSEEAFEFFINAIRISLPTNFEYKVIPEKETNKNNLVRHFINQDIEKNTINIVKKKVQIDALPFNYKRRRDL